MTLATESAAPAARAGASGPRPRLVSVVVPFFNEEPTLADLTGRVAEVLGQRGEAFEILLVNDGSTDGGRRRAAELARQHDHVRLVSLRRNFGKAAALSAGFSAARGDVIVTMDADLQDVPEELPKFLERIDEGYEVVSGWKKERLDPLSKRLPSKIFNAVLASAFSLRLHDFNCGFKAYSREAAKHLEPHLYGDLHRFTPAILHSAGFRIAELPVQHAPRRFGYSKYGARRLIRGLLDLLTVILLTRYRVRPLHLFGSVGLCIGTIGALGLIYLTVLWFLGMGPIGDRPLLLFSVLFALAGLQFVGVGLIGELLTMTHSTDGKHYLLEPQDAAAGDWQTEGATEGETTQDAAARQGLPADGSPGARRG